MRAYLNFVKIEHTLFSLPVIYSGVALGSPHRWPSLRILLLFPFTFFWVAGFDIIYATQDTASHRSEGLHSIPAALGDRRAVQVSGLLHIAAFGCLAVLTWAELNRMAALPFLVLAGLLLYLEHRMARNVAVAFFRINAVLGFVVLALVLAGVVSR